jgi:iron complex outermembrane recepter protein
MGAKKGETNMGIMKHAALRLASTSGLAVALSCVAAVPAYAQQARYTFNIPAQDLESALKAFGRTTKVELIYDGRKVSRNVVSINTKEVKGSFTAKDALVRMLEGTGFSVRTGASGVLMVDGGPGSARVGNDDEADDRRRGDVASRGISDILVIGRRTQNSDIRRTEDDAQPYQVFSKEDIQKSQATTLEDFFRTRLTTNTLAGSESQKTSPQVAGGPGSTRSSINLRGLGTNQTLILVDGRRLGDLSIQSDSSVTASGQPDINGIPLASIERIEVLSSTAGGIYGGNAVGGVINIILRHDYRGLELTANYQDTGDFKFPSGRLDVTGGIALEGGRTNITFSGSISRSGVLRVGDRPFSQRGFDLGLANVPDAFVRNDALASIVIGRGVNIARQGGTAPLTFKAAYGGGSLGGRITNVPIGFSGSDIALAAALRANVNTLNTEAPVGNNGAQRSLMSAPETRSFNVNVRRKFSDSLDIYADFNKFVNRGSAFGSLVPPAVQTLLASSPVNPFNETIVVLFDNKNLATPYNTQSDTNRATLGFNLRLPHQWAVGFDYTWNWARTKASFYRTAIDTAGRNCAQIGIAPASPACTAANGGNPADTRAPINVLLNPDFSDYTLKSPTSNRDFSTTLWTPALRIAGPLFRLPAGPVNFTGKLERNISRTKIGLDTSASFFNRNDAAPATKSYTAYSASQEISTSQYGELNIPLFGDRNATTLLQELSFQISARHDAYETTQSKVRNGLSVSPVSLSAAIAGLGDATQTGTNQASNFTAAVRYSPLRDVVFRASYGSGFTQPTVNQVVANIIPAGPGGRFQTRDPLRGNTVQLQNYEYIDGGAGFDFRPERSKSYSFGVIVTPRFLPGLRLSADYSLTKKTDELTGIGFVTLLARPDLFPGRVVRAPLTPADISLGYTGGVIITLNNSIINLYKSRVSSIDFQGDYDFSLGNLGEFRIFGSATYLPELRRQLSVNDDVINYAGFSDGPLKWRANGGIGWTLGGLNVQYSAQFYNSYLISGATDAQFFDDSAVITQGSEKIPSQLYQDLFVSYAFQNSSGALSGLKLSFGIQNLFNRAPPTIASLSYSAGGYSGYGDPRLRRFSLTIKKSFGN